MDIFSIEIDRSNNDIDRFIKAHQVMYWEIAEWIGTGIEEFWLLMSEPLTKSEKSKIARTVELIAEYNYRKTKEEDKKDKASERLIKYARSLSAHCVLAERPVHRSSYDRYEGTWD